MRYKDNMKAMVVTTAPTAPGRGRETHDVGLIYDPELYDALCAHGVAVEFGSGGKMAGVQAGLLRMFGPVFITLAVVAWSLTLGRSPDADDPLFGGARMELIKSGDVSTTFDDVAGIDDIKEEIMEVVSFLREQVRVSVHAVHACCAAAIRHGDCELPAGPGVHACDHVCMHA